MHRLEGLNTKPARANNKTSAAVPRTDRPHVLVELARPWRPVRNARRRYGVCFTESGHSS